MKVVAKRLTDSIVVVIERKKIKNVRLRVLPDGRVKLSVPFGVAKPWIDDYLQKKLPWIEKALAFFKDRVNNEIETKIQNGASACILGKQVTISVKSSKVYRIEQNGDAIHMQSPVSDNQPALARQYERWLHKQSKKYFSGIIDKWYPVIASYGFAKPELQVKKMKTRWGSCSPAHHKINLNRTLYQAPPDCIDYVVLHELGHFLYPRHDQEFYAFLTAHMPDWRARKQLLNYGVV
ncbi:MAG: SprT family zinc-dependent metalloprotease [Syntrophomonadaceae bacterium]|nr:SprT family zinc-dependent metalloprotease [Syntrophomonadaceae bacterium]